MDALEAITTCRAMRYLRADPVDEDLIRKVLHAASCASSPGNSQGWTFVVVRDASQRAEIAKALHAALAPVLPKPDGAPDAAARRMLTGVHHLLDHLGDVPVWIFVCGVPNYPPAAPSADWLPAALYPAAQNLIVAARSLGLGTVFTTFHQLAEPRVRELLGLPADAHIGVTIPLGWPEREFGPLRRKPLDLVVRWDRW